MKKAYEKFCRFEQALAIFLLSLITILVFAAALTRTFGFPINWAQDVALIAFAWMVFIGGDIAVRTTGLIGVDLFVKMFPKKVQKALDILFKVIILVFLAVHHAECDVCHGYGLRARRRAADDGFDLGQTGGSHQETCGQVGGIRYGRCDCHLFGFPAAGHARRVRDRHFRLLVLHHS